MKEAHGVVAVSHILPIGSSAAYPCAVLNQSHHEWYDIYREQIEQLWEKGTPWSSDSE